MKDHMISIGNVPAQFFDNRKGDIKNRAACAGETLANNAVNTAKSYGIVAGTALAVDTFAGNKVATSFIAKKFPKVAEFGKKVAENVVNSAKKLLDSPVGKKITEKTAGIASKVATKFPQIAEFGKKAIHVLKNNKRTAILAAGATALFGVLLKWTHKQGRIDQKYEDKAKIDAHNKNHDVDL